MREARTTIADVPFTSARPSLKLSFIGFSPAFHSASFADIITPLYLAFHRPAPTNAMHASGPRSPLAPRDPFCGIHGMMPALNIAISFLRFSAEIAEFPFAREQMRARIIARTSISEKYAP